MNGIDEKAAARNRRRKIIALRILGANLLVLLGVTLTLPLLVAYPPTWVFVALLVGVLGLLGAELVVIRSRPKPLPESEWLRRDDDEVPRGDRAALDADGL